MRALLLLLLLHKAHACTCGVNREGEMPDWNCCWPGGSWAGSCTETGPKTWHAGWHSCKERNDAERRRAHGDAQGHFGRGMARVCPWASAKVVQGPRGRGISVVYLIYGASGAETRNVAFFSQRGLDEATKIDGGTSVQILRPEHLGAEVVAAQRDGLNKAIEDLASVCKGWARCATHAYAGAKLSWLAVAQALRRPAAAYVLATSRAAGPVLPTYYTGAAWPRALASLLDNATALVATALRVDGCDARVDLSRGAVALSPSLARQLLVAGLDRIESDAVRMVRDGREVLRTLEPGFEGVDWDAFWALCASKGTPRVRKDARSPFAKMFATDAPPVTFPRDWHSTGRDVVAARRWKGNTLVLYAYHETPEAKKNMAFFLQHGLRDLMAHVTIVVNGPSTLEFPAESDRFKNTVRVLRRDNTCFDFGSWGVALADARKRIGRLINVILMNASVRGPFLPAYARTNWVDGFLSLLRKDVALAGLAINCPDGEGRKIPHVMSMAMILDERALKLANDHGIFACAATYDEAVEREGRLSKLVLDADLNLGTMQWNYFSTDWRKVLKQVEHAPLVPNAANFPSCPGVDLDIFYKEGWHHGTNPHPVEFLFYKTNRGVGSDALDARSSPRAATPKRVLLASHNFDGDGAPRYLLHAAEVLEKDHYSILAWSFERDGPLRQEFESLGAEIIPSPTAEQRVEQKLNWKDVTLASVLKYVNTDVDVVVLNTVLWANVIASSDGRVGGSGPRIVWILHEMEITEHSVPRHERFTSGVGFWYGQWFPALLPARRCATLERADSVVFVADAQRALWSSCDRGTFFTVRGRPNAQDEGGDVALVDFETVASQAEAAKREKIQSEAVQDRPQVPPAALFKPSVVQRKKKKKPRGHRHEHRQLSTTSVREQLSIPHDAFVLTTIGTICRRKRQKWALHAVRHLVKQGLDAYYVLIGAPSPRGGQGDPEYVVEFMAAARNLNLQSRLRLVPFGANVALYLAVADLHCSPSSLEAYPLNTLEAMRLGVPVVATAAGGTEEQFPRGLPGLVRNASSSKAFLEAVTRASARRGDRLRGDGQKLREAVAAPAADRFATALRDAFSFRRTRPLVSFVVRAYWRQMDTEPFTLRKTLQALRRLREPRWEALIVQTDATPIPGLFRLLSEFRDPRLRPIVFKDAPQTTAGGYELTDRALALARASQYLVVTNGDNLYDARFLDSLSRSSSDLVAFDFYSRHVSAMDTRYLGEGCERYFSAPNGMCKRNLLAPWHTDLGANALSVRRWNCEERRFLDVDAGPGEDRDGKVAWSLVYWGWDVSHVRADDGGCLFDHNPNAHACVASGEDWVWFERERACVKHSALEDAEPPPAYYESPRLPAGTEALQGRCAD